MITFLHKHGRPNLVLFVHGFTGGIETWRNSSGKLFHELLTEDPALLDNYDFAYFEYYTKFTNLFPAANTWVSRLKMLVGRSHRKVEKNVGISEISEMFRSQLRFQVGSYANVVLIAHSMGGLVVKNALAQDLSRHAPTQVRMMLSLAVPHLGANLATFAKLLSSNEHLADLAPLSDFCSGLNDRWLKLANRPPIKYFYGTYDDVVTKASATGTDNIEQDIIACDDDHLSIVKPLDSSSIAITATRAFLADFLHATKIPDGGKLLKLKSDAELADEYFVLKLMLADVHVSTIRHCKENFLNAEYTRKLFSSRTDQEKLAQLYERIRTLYHDSFDKFINSKSPKKTPGELVAEIHEKIVHQDDGYLKSALPVIHALHKKGMLHQLANDLEGDVWWSEEKSVEALDKLKNLIEDSSTPA